MKERTNKSYLKVALIAGISTFVGFSSIFIFMILIDGITNWRNFTDLLGVVLILFGYFLFYGTAIIGLIEAFIVGLTVYFIFKFFVPNNLSKKQLKITIIMFSVICAIIGLLSFSSADRFVRESSSEKEHVWEVDTNGDKKIDKWVHDNIYGKTIEIDYDTNLDGKPDVWEYYKNDKVYKKESDTDSDGKPNKIENY